MRVLIAATIICIACLLSEHSFAQQVETGSDCPQITIDCPLLFVPLPGSTLTLKAILGRPDLGTHVSYKWKLSQGTIISGQGNSSVVVQASDLYNTVIDVELEVEGLKTGCSNKAFCKIVIPVWDSFCPIITVDSPDNVETNNRITFQANITGGDPEMQPTFKWTISAGTIQSGQGTSVITVDTTTTGGKNVTATVEIGGIEKYCTNTASFTSEVVRLGNWPHKFDEYGNLPNKDEEERLTRFAERLRNQRSYLGYVYVYAGQRARAAEAQSRIQKAMKYLVSKGIKKDRLVLKDGGHRHEFTVELWLLLPGAPEPIIIPTVPVHQVEIINPGKSHSDN